MHPHADYGQYQLATVEHAISKARGMGVPLSMDISCKPAAQAVLGSRQATGSLTTVEEPLVLAPSSGVVEASDTLTNKHDWVQTDEETTARLYRLMFVPS